MSETLTALHPWLAQFPTAGRSYVVAWFGYAVSQGAQTPEGALAYAATLLPAPGTHGEGETRR
jgi:hypothetical protein